MPNKDIAPSVWLAAAFAFAAFALGKSALSEWLDPISVVVIFWLFVVLAVVCAVMALRTYYIDVGRGTATHEASTTTPRTYIVITYSAEWKTYINDGTEEEYEDWDEQLVFTNAGEEILRRVEVPEFSVLGTARRIAPFSQLLPSVPESRPIRLMNDFESANRTTKIYHRAPIGVAMTVHYYGQSSSDLQTANYVIIYEKGSIRIDPIIDDREYWLDISQEP